VRKFIFITLAAALSVLLGSIACGILVPAIDRLLLWPGFRLSKALGISEEGGNYVAAGIGFAWMLWTAILAVVVTVIEKTIWRRRKLFVACVVAVCAILLLQARGKHNKEYDGTWEFGDERSAFYPSSGCWRLPYWLDSTSELSGPSGKLVALGNPSAVNRLRLRRPQRQAGI